MICELMMCRSVSSKSLFLSVGVLIATATGCTDPQSKTYPVRGIVRFTDGKLLRDGLVEFEIMGRKQPTTATGEIRPDGTFVLGTHSLDDGALAGKHRVVVISDYSIGTGAERPGLIPEVQLHRKYRDFNSSGLIHEVQPRTNNFVLEVEYAPTTASSP